MNDRLAVSLLIPVYNVEKYLPEAMESALGQTLGEIEIICIDDGSTDGSGHMLDCYGEEDARVRVVHRANGGYGSAMNKALDMARGDYVAILEPDDFLDSHMLEELYYLAEEYRADFVKSDFAFLEGEPGSYHISPVHIHWRREMYGKLLDKTERRELFRGYLAHWSCLYRRSFLEGHRIRFNESPGASYQDTGFWFQTMTLAQRVYLHEGNYYRYRQDNPGASMLDGNKVLCISAEYDFIRRQLEKRGLLQEYWPEFLALCFIGHRDALYRAAECCRGTLIDHIAGYFGSLQAEKKLDTGFMEVQDRELLQRILLDPEKFREAFAAVPDYIHDRLAGCRDFYIYGSGTRGKRIYQYLREEDKLRCRGFVVTNLGDVTQVLGQPVYAADEAGIGRQTGIIIGVTERYRQEIENNLLQRGIDTVIFLPEEKVP